jgi:hypothetical protein
MNRRAPLLMPRNGEIKIWPRFTLKVSYRMVQAHWTTPSKRGLRAWGHYAKGVSSGADPSLADAYLDLAEALAKR